MEGTMSLLGTKPTHAGGEGSGTIPLSASAPAICAPGSLKSLLAAQKEVSPGSISVSVELEPPTSTSSDSATTPGQSPRHESKEQQGAGADRLIDIAASQGSQGEEKVSERAEQAATESMADEPSIGELMRRMLQKFEKEDSPGFLSGGDFDPACPEVFFLLVKWYQPAWELAKEMVDLYRAGCVVEQSEGCTGSVVQTTSSRKWSIARAFRYWILHFPSDFTSQSHPRAYGGGSASIEGSGGSDKGLRGSEEERGSASVMSHLKELQRLMIEGKDEEILEYISTDSINGDDDSWMYSAPVMLRRDMRRDSLGFDATSARELAEILCLLDYHLFRKIPFNELCVYARAAKPTKDTPCIDECIQYFNGLTNWIVCNILREITMVKRADTVEKFIDTCRHLYYLHSYNTLLAVVGGLTHFSIRRLSLTWNKVEKSKREDLNKWSNVFISQHNYSTYRQKTAQQEGMFFVPVLGIVLKDLVAINVQAHDLVGVVSGGGGANPQGINMHKYRNLWNVVSSIRRSQLTAPKFTPDPDRMRVLKPAIIHSQMDDDNLEELSISREPRHRDSFINTSGGDLPKFSEWATGHAPQLDTQIITGHVKQMVEAVFKAYDRDQSGTISLKEFQAISSNFPFIECFSVLDQDNDGEINREEMTSYFLSANSSLKERFTHSFVEHTFIGTPACEHCKGMMKGIVKQGVRCKDCGVTCHKYCKDHLVMDCSSRKKLKKSKKKRPESAMSQELYYEDDDTSLKDRLQRAEAARDALSAENNELVARLAEANAKIQQLTSHISSVRQHTITFILEQLNTLNPTLQGTDV